MAIFDDLRNDFKNDFKKFKLMEAEITFNAATLLEKFRLQSKVKEDGVLKLKNYVIIRDKKDKLHNVIGIKSDDNDNTSFVTIDGTELSLIDVSSDTLLNIVLGFCCN